MKKLLPLFLLLIMATSVSAANVSTVPVPTILVEYAEEVGTSGAIIFGEMNQDMVLVDPSQPASSYELKPENSLTNGEYTLEIDAYDVVGNSRLDRYDFVVDVPFGIVLLEPSFGYSSTPVYDIVVRTTEEAYCAWSRTLSGATEIATKFTTDSVGNYTTMHTLEDASFNEEIWIKCTNEEGQQVNQSYDFIVDQSPPDIEVEADPSLIEDPANIKSEVTISLDDPSVCWLNDESLNESDELKESTYKTEFAKTLTYDVADMEKHVYNYNVRCKNKAGIESTEDFNITVQLTSSFSINVIEPGTSTNKQPVNLYLETSITTACEYKGNESWIPFGSEDTRHETSLGDLEEGSHSYNVKCVAPNNAQETKKVDFTVDFSKPTNVSISAEDTCDLNNLAATFSATDAQGIKEYKYSVTSGGSTIFNGTTSGTEVTKGGNITAGRSYQWSMTAVDGAGNEQAASPVTVDARNESAPACDEFRPYVELDPQPGDGGTNFGVSCEDDNSGCEANYNYSIVPKDTACVKGDRTRGMGQSIFVPCDQKLCLWVSDNNGNTVFKEHLSRCDGEGYDADNESTDDIEVRQGSDEEESGPVCGNGKIDEGEDCDGTSMGDVLYCSDLDLEGGSVTCASDCTYDTSDCRSTTEEFTPEEEGTNLWAILLLVLGLLMMGSGGGYIGYKQYTGDTHSPTTPPGRTQKPSWAREQQKTQQQQQKTTPDQVREREKKKLLQEKRREKKKEEREELFDKFDVKSEKEADTKKVLSDMDDVFGDEENE